MLCFGISYLKGHVRAHEEMRAPVYYVPGIPEVFEKVFQLQVAFFEPESITLKGEGTFSRVCLDLPRDISKTLRNMRK